VVFALTLGLHLASSAFAEGRSAPPSVDVAGKPYDEVKVREVTDFAGVAKTYPCLQPDVKRIQADRKEPEFAGTKVYVGEYASKDAGSVVVLLLNGQLYCGSHGCALSVYRKSGNTCRLALELLVSPDSPIHVSSDQKSLLACGGSGRALWKMDGGQQVAAPVMGDAKLKPCF
jgi:hypothetical protein